MFVCFLVQFLKTSTMKCHASKLAKCHSIFHRPWRLYLCHSRFNRAMFWLRQRQRKRQHSRAILLLSKLKIFIQPIPNKREREREIWPCCSSIPIYSHHRNFHLVPKGHDNYNYTITVTWMLMSKFFIMCVIS